MTPVAPAPSTSVTAPERARLHQAAQAFEAIFVRTLLASARASAFGDDAAGGDQARETFTALRDERFADIAAQTGAFGLARQVEAQLAVGTPAPADKRP